MNRQIDRQTDEIDSELRQSDRKMEREEDGKMER